MNKYLLLIWDYKNERNFDLIPPFVFTGPAAADKCHENAVQYKEEPYNYSDVYFNLERNADAITLDYLKDLNTGTGCYDGKLVLNSISTEMENLPEAEWYDRGEENKEPFLTYHMEWIPEGFFARAGKGSLLKYLIEKSGKALPRKQPEKS